MNKYIIIGAIIIVAYLYLSKRDKPVVSAPVVTPPVSSTDASTAAQPAASTSATPESALNVNSSASVAHDQIITPPTT